MILIMTKKQASKPLASSIAQSDKTMRRLKKIKNSPLKRQKKIWTDSEDEQLLRLINDYGAAKWSTIANFMPGRQGKQCRERWHNHLNPQISKTDWCEDEEWVLFLLHRLYGNKWAILAQIISGRTDNAIKNHWNSIMKRKIRQYELRMKKETENIDQLTGDSLEQRLLISIAKGEFDNKSCRKGRKRNYNIFFEKNQLQNFVIKKAEPVVVPENPVEEEQPQISIVYEITSPVQARKRSSLQSLFDTKTPNANEKDGNEVRITSYHKDFEFLCYSVSGKKNYVNENIAFVKNSELSFSKHSSIGFGYRSPSKRIFETSAAKMMGFKTPEHHNPVFGSVYSLNKPWY